MTDKEFEMGLLLQKIRSWLKSDWMNISSTFFHDTDKQNRIYFINEIDEVLKTFEKQNNISESSQTIQNALESSLSFLAETAPLLNESSSEGSENV